MQLEHGGYDMLDLDTFFELIGNYFSFLEFFSRQWHQHAISETWCGMIIEVSFYQVSNSLVGLYIITRMS